jgi:hypothetical protein
VNIQELRDLPNGTVIADTILDMRVVKHGNRLVYPDGSFIAIPEGEGVIVGWIPRGWDDRMEKRS